MGYEAPWPPVDREAAIRALLSDPRFIASEELADRWLEELARTTEEDD